ncbi:hypothetical protein NL676_033996 [Syzygium grande]|nr:hypothetical protein NL676_033996 [Syzygium grande]
MPCEDDDEKEEIRRRPSVMDLHPHQLSSYHSRTRTKIKCQKCYDPIPSGDFFGCPDCSFFLHESCAQPPVHAIQHYLHPEHTLTFAKLPDEKEHECPSCESPVRSDSYCYTCQVCDFFIHQTCASATLSDLEKGVGMTVQYSFHEHELKLYYDYYDSEKCAACDGTIGWEVPAYKCFSRGCEFKLHKSCAQLPSHFVHPSHSLHPLTFCFKPPSTDTVCRRCSAGIRDTFAFSCGECNFHLHVDCARKPTLRHPFQEHSLLYFATADSYGGWACSACRKSCSVDLFRCVQCDFTLHHDCSQFLPTIKIARVECALSPVKLEVVEEDDLIRLKEDTQGREEEIKLGQQQVKAKEVSLRPLMEELVSMRAKLESQRAELKELKTERAKYINMEVMEEDKSIRGEDDFDATDGELETLRAILKKLETEQAKWLIDFLKTKCNLQSALFSQ